MQTSRDFATSLLPGYAFVEHAFFAASHLTFADAQRSLACYARYDMRITRMCLPKEWNEPLVDTASGQSVLPASLVALTFGQQDKGEKRCSMLHAASEALGKEESETTADGEQQLQGLTRRWTEKDNCDTWDVHQYGACAGGFDTPIPPGEIAFNQPLPSGVLPTSLPELFIGNALQPALQPGSLPDGLEVLSFRRSAGF